MKSAVTNEVKKAMQAVYSNEEKLQGVKNVVRIPGDASTRRYFRIETKDRSFILMKMEPFSSKQLTPFLIVQEHLVQSGVAVPKVFNIDAEKGLILLQDLGDITFLRRLQGISNPEVERHLYEQVIDQLIQMQLQASPEKHPSKKLDAFQLRFDEEKLMWEVNFTIENFYEFYLKRKLKKEDKNLMFTEFREICRTLASQPTVLTHRDFHSRNIMVEGKDKLYFIDFQDARLGPAQYDLASLLKDSYYQLEEAQIRMLLDYYVVKYEALSGQKMDRKEFSRVFDLMSIQRNFKAIGSFASFLNKRGDATYLKYIGNTFENIRRTLLKYPQYSDLREVLFHYYYF